MGYECLIPQSRECDQFNISSPARAILDFVWVLRYPVLGRSHSSRRSGCGSLALGNNALLCRPSHSPWESCSDIRVRRQVHKQTLFAERRQFFAAFGPSIPLLVSSDMNFQDNKISTITTSYPRFIRLHHDIPSNLRDSYSCHWIFH